MSPNRSISARQFREPESEYLRMMMRITAIATITITPSPRVIILSHL